jgi:assimilatory nitrate reductase catalytic subunit
MASAVAGYKRAFGADAVPCSYQDLELAKLIVIVGSNTAWCHPVLFQRIAHAKGRHPDLQVVVIDPRRTPTCDIADLHLPIRADSDGWLFNGLLAFLAEQGEIDAGFLDAHTTGWPQALAAARTSAPNVASVADHCGLEATDVARFYQLFARTERVVTLYSQGSNQSAYGSDKNNAIINCHLATGRLGRRGMGPFSITGQPNAMGGREVGGLANQLAAHMDFSAENCLRVQRFWRAPTIAREPGLKAIDLFQAVAQGKIKALWIMGTNPLVSLPDAEAVRRALARCPLVVVSDVVQDTDTLRLAHIKLPALAWGEKEGTVTNSERRISRQRAFLAPPGEARPDWWIIARVAERMGYREEFSYPSAAAVFREHAALSAHENDGRRAFDIGALAPISDPAYGALMPVQWPLARPGAPGTTRLFGDGRFFTPDGRARLQPVVPQPPMGELGSNFPHVLNTGRVRDQWHTMTRTGRSARLSRHDPEPLVSLHPEDAARTGLCAGDFAQVESARGTALLRVAIDPGLRQGELFAPMHWGETFARHARINALVAAHTDPLSGQPQSKYTPVRITRWPAAWQGLLATRRSPPTPSCAYWVRSRGAGLWFTAIADAIAFEFEAGNIGRLLGADAGEEWGEYRDPRAASYRAILVRSGRVESALFVARGKNFPDRSWLEQLFAREELAHEARVALLAGRAPAKTAEAGRIICACHGIGEEALRAAVASGADSITALGQRLRAGTGCGACVPELRRFLAPAEQ